MPNILANNRAEAAEISVLNIEKSYGATRAVQGVSFTIEPGHVLSLLGPSGCGKTTIMRMIAGLIDPTGGDIRVAGVSITATPVHRRNIGMLFQNYALFPHLTVARNVAFGLEMRKVDRGQIDRQVAATLAMVQMTHLADRMPHQLSGGQQQRVGLARALVIEPAVLLLDEPFGALDKKLRESMQIEMRQLQQRLGITTLMVTHDQDEALTLSDRVAVMYNGRIEQLGTPKEIYDKPATRFVANFIGTSNFLSGIIARRTGEGYLVTTADGLTLQIDGTPPADEKVTVSLRPESIALSAAGPAVTNELNCGRAVIEQIVYHGLNTQFHLRRPSGETFIVVRQNDARDEPFDTGMEVDIRWEASRLHVIVENPA